MFTNANIKRYTTLNDYCISTLSLSPLVVYNIQKFITCPRFFSSYSNSNNKEKRVTTNRKKKKNYTMIMNLFMILLENTMFIRVVNNKKQTELA